MKRPADQACAQRAPTVRRCRAQRSCEAVIVRSPMNLFVCFARFVPTKRGEYVFWTIDSVVVFPDQPYEFADHNLRLHGPSYLSLLRQPDHKLQRRCRAGDLAGFDGVFLAIAAACPVARHREAERAVDEHKRIVDSCFVPRFIRLQSFPSVQESSTMPVRV